MVTAAGAIRALGVRSARLVATLVPTPPSPTFCQPWSCFASPYSGCQNVSYLERYMQCA